MRLSLRTRRLVALGLVACLAVASLPAQSSSGTTTAGTTTAGTTTAGTTNPDSLPEPYGDDEFPAWARALRRFEIVSLGAFPLLLSYTRLAVDIARFVGNDFAPGYAPWPFKPTNAVPFTAEEQWSCIFVAAGLAAAFGLADAIIVWTVPLD